MWCMKLLWFSLLSRRCLPFFKTDLIILSTAVLSTPTLPWCCFVVLTSDTHYAAPSKDKQTTLVAKLKLPNTCHAAPVSRPPYGFLCNPNSSAIKQTYRVHEGWYPTRWPSTTMEEPVQCGSRPQSSHWYLFPETSIQTFLLPIFSDICNTHLATMSLQTI